MISVKALPFEKQDKDKLEDGLLKLDAGSSKEELYADIFVCSKEVEGELKEFADLSKQDRLKEGLIKVGDTEYFHINDLGEIKVIADIYPRESDEFLEECFIATAVYGDANHPNVLRLQEFKRDVLMQNPFGRAFTDFYYSGAGKGIADFVKKHLPSSIPVIRKCLDFVVDNYSRNR
ncbi:hypothetical protein HYU07_06530 [Candidatus Woesearchaeota archaeon]|nr:hypothetical protein [Candidatus Woesearchaeota archaeon]